MGSIIREITLNASPDAAWSAVADVGNVHTRFVPGFVRDTVLADGVRTVTFANGVVIREVIVSVDSERRRIAYGSVGGQASHHNSSIEVVATGVSSCLLIWTTDVLPDALVPFILRNIEAATPIIKATIEAQSRG